LSSLFVTSSKANRIIPGRTASRSSRFDGGVDVGFGFVSGADGHRLAAVVSLRDSPDSRSNPSTDHMFSWRDRNSLAVRLHGAAVRKRHRGIPDQLRPMYFTNLHKLVHSHLGISRQSQSCFLRVRQLPFPTKAQI
jgi:hypothetical protein